MQQWHFRISGRVILENDNRVLNLYPENIATLMRISNYKDEHMPQMLMKARLDKNLIDIIVTNAKTATIYLKIEKFDKTDEDQTESERSYMTYIEDEFSIFVDNDINHNKETDYIDKSSAGEEEERKDLYKEIYIGLMSKSCLEANKVPTNCVFYKTSLLNMVAYYLRGVHALIEPFKYNPTIEQLIVPPQETLVQTIKFLSDVKVFYDTSYTLFIDEPSCTYLISRSGFGLEKNDDIFLNVCFNVHPKQERESTTPGMAIDTEGQRYYVDINVADTKYTINHDLAKIYDQIQEIINPDVSNTISTMNQVQDAISSVKSVVDQVKSTASNVQTQFKKLGTEIESIPNQLHQCKSKFNSSLKDFIAPYLSLDTIEKYIPSDNVPSLVSRFKTIINSIPSSTSSGSGTTVVLSDIEKTSINGRLDTYLNGLNEEYNKAKRLNDDFAKLTDDTTSACYKLQTMDNNLGCFSEVNAQDGVKATNKSINMVCTASDLISSTTTQVQSDRSCISSMQTNYQNILSTESEAINLISSRAGSSSNVSTYLTQLREIYNTMNNKVGPTIINNLNVMNTSIDTHKLVADMTKDASNTFKNMTSDITKIATTDLKSKIKGIKTDLSNIGKTAETALEKIKKIGSTPISFNINDLGALEKNISAIADLTGIGQLGKSSFITDLKLGQTMNNINKGLKILKTVNDNANKIKNVKSDMENQLNKLTVNKYDLDPSVLTPNKRYSVKNYNGHKDKDGIFILNKKTEAYIREDDTFFVSVMLEFAKVMDEK